jgi:DNA anti-recombination protein RmuC
VLLSDVPGWVWQVVGAIGGLGLGLGLGALWLRAGQRRKRSSRSGERAAASRMAGNSRPANSQLSSRMSGGLSALPESHSQWPSRGETPQERLLERLRENNLDLSAQLRASAAQHARLLRDKDTEVAALKDDYDQRVEELRQTHSSELKYLMTLLVEQVDGLHKTHANLVRGLEAEIERLRGASRLRAPDPQDAEDTTTFAATESMDVRRRAH